MTDLHLRDTESGETVGTLTLSAAGTVTAAGEAAELATAVLGSYERSLPATPAAAFAHIERWGWANGPLSLSP